jgi:hypothetical protein
MAGEYYLYTYDRNLGSCKTVIIEIEIEVRLLIINIEISNKFIRPNCVLIK